MSDREVSIEVDSPIVGKHEAIRTSNNYPSSNLPLTVSIIIPVYNEINTIEPLLTRVRSQNVEFVNLETIVVDDGSDDGTRELLQNNPHLYDHLIQNQRNLGKGGAVREGLRKSKADYVLFQDADLEYDPIEYGKLISPILSFNADVVMGSRFLAPQWTRVFYFFHKIGNLFICTLFNLLFNTTWTDIYSCYLLFRRELINPNKLRSNGWEQQAEILAKLCRLKIQLYEVPINYNGRTYEEGKKIRWHHTLNVIYMIIIARIFRLGQN